MDISSIPFQRCPQHYTESFNSDIVQDQVPLVAFSIVTLIWEHKQKWSFHKNEKHSFYSNILR